ncbi:MAG: Jag N-terminal domain-containing protein [Deltaproteobacteria bacterium]|nr:Jag N-terminal domain-containing protein [Deltaproteobacteria bacterium]
MMQTYEFQGKTAEDAIEKACRTLSLTKDGMEIEILEPGSAGIFGLVGGRKAKIKVCIPERENKPREEPEQETKQEPVQRSEQGAEQEIDQPIEAAEEKNGLAVAKEALENILTLIPMESTTVTAEQTNGIISLDIEGDKSGLLIGRKGRTLDALQFIVNKIVNKTLEKRTQVVVDSESYRKRRKEFLTQMALQMGAKAKKMKKPVATNLLYPHDRRIVHLALRDDGELSTKSRGDGLFKKVIIIPRG